MPLQTRHSTNIRHVQNELFIRYGFCAVLRVLIASLVAASRQHGFSAKVVCRLRRLHRRRSLQVVTRVEGDMLHRLRSCRLGGRHRVSTQGVQRRWLIPTIGGWHVERKLLLIGFHGPLLRTMEGLFLTILVADHLIPFFSVYTRDLLTHGIFDFNLLQPALRLQPLQGWPILTRSAAALLPFLGTSASVFFLWAKVHSSQMPCSTVVLLVGPLLFTTVAGIKRPCRSPAPARLVRRICGKRIGTDPGFALPGVSRYERSRDGGGGCGVLESHKDIRCEKCI